MVPNVCDRETGFLASAMRAVGSIELNARRVAADE
jgi:hypothetical protein